jgi:hypothetical protein
MGGTALSANATLVPIRFLFNRTVNAITGNTTTITIPNTGYGASTIEGVFGPLSGISDSAGGSFTTPLSTGTMTVQVDYAHLSGGWTAALVLQDRTTYRVTGTEAVPPVVTSITPSGHNIVSDSDRRAWVREGY